MTHEPVVAAEPEDHVVASCPMEGVVAGGPDDRGSRPGTALRRVRRGGGQREDAEKTAAPLVVAVLKKVRWCMMSAFPRGTA